MTVHRYNATCSWTGSTGQGYDAYERAHAVGAPPAETRLGMSSDPAYLGDGRLLNPEQLVVMAASSCQLLELLSLAARARVDVTMYDDDAEGLMDDSKDPASIELIVLRPRIWATGATEERVLKLVDQAHRHCYVANSLRTEIRIEPTVEIR